MRQVLALRLDDFLPRLRVFEPSLSVFRISLHVPTDAVNRGLVITVGESLHADGVRIAHGAVAQMLPHGQRYEATGDEDHNARRDEHKTFLTTPTLPLGTRLSGLGGSW
ncbi:MAG: hypothetical protein AAGK78_06405 [Planctomycetota bacterium]